MSTSGGPRFGPGATAALARMVADVKGDDPLAPVDVVTPNAVSGMTLRRAIADPALANIRFGSLPQVAERLALRRLALEGLRLLTESMRGLAMRRALQTAGGELAEAAQHPATAQLIENIITELEDVEAHVAGGLEWLADASARGRELAEIYRAYQTAKDDRLSAAEIYDQAAAAVIADQAPDTTLILFAPERLSPPERRLVAALADRDRLRCILPRTGDIDADAAGQELVAWLETLLGAPAVDDHGPEQQVTLSLEPDAEEEVRQAVRRALAYLTKHPVRPERIGICYRSPIPYARLLDEQLSVAGLPFHDLLAGVRARVAVTATSLVSAAEAEAVADERDPDAAAPQSSTAPRPPRMPARTGAAIGSAVHAVLELVDLTGWTDQEVTAISALVCQRLDIPQLVNEVSIRLRNALTARLVAEAGTSGRCWREVYVVSHDGQRYVEGYIDLLVEGDDGLTIVDYKTDRVRTDADRKAKARHYRPQLRAYADALGRVPGVRIDKAALLFVGGEGATEVPIEVSEPRSAERGQ